MSSTPGNREVAHRLFAAEFDDASYSYSESDEERAPNYVVTPTGARVNRMFATGVLTEVAQAGDSILRARVVDPTGAFVVYAGQYQPEAMAFLDGADTPSFVAVTGKARTFQPEDSDLVYTSVRPESVSEVDAPTRDRWTVTAAERTLERIGVFAAALDTGLTGDALTQALQQSGVDASLAAGIPIAIEQYGTTTAYLAALQDVVLDAVRLVADEADEVRDLGHSPDEGGDVSFTPVKPVDIDVSVAAESVATPDAADSVADTSAETTESSAPASETPEPAAGTDDTDATADPVEDPSDQPVEAGVDGTTDPAAETVSEESEAPAEPTETPAAATESGETADAGVDAASDDEPTFDAAEQTSDESVEETAEDTAADQTESTADDDEGGAYEMDEETRQEVESEYGTDFSTGNEVSPAGEADIETPTPEETPESDTPAEEPEFEPDDTPTEREPEPATESDEPTFEPADEGEETADAEADEEPAAPALDTSEDDTDGAEASDDDTDADAGADADADADADGDVETVLLEEMRSLDGGDGAPRDELVSRVTDRTGADEGAVDDAIQEALMSGQCYEPADGRLTPI